MKHIYLLTFKDLHSTFNLFSYTSELTTQFLNFDVTRDDVQKLDTSKIHFYDFSQKNSKEYFLQKISNKLKDLSINKTKNSDLILSLKNWETVPKNTSLGKLILNNIVNDLNSINKDAFLTVEAKSELVTEYLALLLALYQNAAIYKKNVAIELERELLNPGKNSLEEKLIGKNPILSTDYSSNRLANLVEFKNENLEKIKLSDEITTKNFNWIVDESFLSRSWDNEEYSLLKVKENFSNIQQISPQLLEQDEFFDKICDIFILYFKEKVGRSYTRDRLEIAEDFFQLFNDAKILKDILNRFFNSSVFLNKMMDKENLIILIALSQESVERYPANHRGSNAVDKNVINNVLENFLSTKKGIKVLSETHSMLNYLPLIPATLMKDLEVVGWVSENASKFRGDSKYNLLNCYLEKVFKEKEEVTFDFLLKAFTHSQPHSLEMGWEARNLCRKVFTSGQITDAQIVELMQHQFNYICSVIDICEGETYFKSRSDDFYTNLLTTGKQKINFSGEQNYKTLGVIKKVIPDSFYNSEKNIETFIECLGFENYITKNKDHPLGKYLLNHPGALQNALRVRPKIIEDFSLDLTLYYNPDNLKYIGIRKLVQEASWSQAYKSSGFQGVVYNLHKEMSLEEQQKLIDIDALYYCAVSPELKLDKNNAVNFITKILSLSGRDMRSNEESWFSLHKVPKEVFNDRDFCIMILDRVMKVDAKTTASLIPKDFWYNRAFILSFAKALDKTNSLEILNYLPLDIKKFFTSFEIKKGENFSFISNYFIRLDLSQDLVSNPALPSSAKKSKI